MSKFSPAVKIKGHPPGTRILCYPAGGEGRTLTGTIVSGAGTLARGDGSVEYSAYVVCVDKQLSNHDPLRRPSSESHTGHCFSAFLPSNTIVPIVNQRAAETWEGVPEHIGVAIRRPVDVDGVQFLGGEVGRLVHGYSDLMPPSQRILVHWLTPPERKKAFRSFESETGITYRTCWSVPSGELRFCFFDTNTKNVLKLWNAAPLGLPEKSLAYEKGAHVIYNHGHAIKVERDGRRYALGKGTIFEVQQLDNARGHLLCGVVGGCAPEMEGYEVRVNPNSVNPFPFLWVSPGAVVEVTEEVKFKKENLQGRRGLVLLPTDGDGDVGVEFKDDIGAGSLDGVGADGHCLYLPATAVKIPE